MATDLYLPHAINFPSGTDITQIDSLPLDPQLDDFEVRAASAVLPGITGHHLSDPEMAFSTTQVADILDHCTIDDIAGAFDGSNVDLEWRKSQSLTGRVAVASTEHARTRATKSLLSWEEISVASGSLASINARLGFISDGTNAPLAVSTGVALGAAAATNEVFTMGPAHLTTASVTGSPLCATAWSWRNNIRFDRVHCNGLGWLEFLAVDTFSPTITIDVEDITNPLALLPSGETLSTLTLYLRHKLQGGVNTPAGTASHVKIAATVGTAKMIAPRRFQVRVHSFTVTTSSAIT